MDEKRIKEVVRKVDYKKIIKNAEKVKNQPYDPDADCLYNDPLFKPQISSLLDLKTTQQDGETVKTWKQYEWKRAPEIFKGEFSVFHERIEMDDIQQGALGN